MFRDESVARLSQLLKRRAELVQAGVAHGDGDIAEKTPVLRPGTGVPRKRVRNSLSLRREKRSSGGAVNWLELRGRGR